MKLKKLIVGTLATLGLVAGVASAQDANMSKEAIAERIKPVGELCLQGEDCGGAAPAAAASGGGSDGKSGEEIYGSVCMACHDTGAAGAPIRGEEAAWADRVSKGFETLLTHSTEGFNAMPARGGNPNLSDDEMYAATAYMLEPVMEVPAQEGGDSATASSEDGGEQAAAEGSEQTAADDSSANAEEAQQSMAQNDASAEPSTDSEQGGSTETAAADAGGDSDLPGASKIGTCVACHGQDGKGTSPMYPNLAGQNDTYLVNALKAYRDGERKGGMSAVMTPMAASLSDEDITDIAEYYSQQTP